MDFSKLVPLEVNYGPYYHPRQAEKWHLCWEWESLEEAQKHAKGCEIRPCDPDKVFETSQVAGKPASFRQVVTYLEQIEYEFPIR